MAAPVGFDGRAGHFRWPIYTTVSMAASVIFDGRAGRFRWPRRSFSMAAPVGFDGRAGRQLCPYEAQYMLESNITPTFLTHDVDAMEEFPMSTEMVSIVLELCLEENNITSVLSAFNLSMFWCIHDSISLRQFSIRVRASHCAASSLGLKDKYSWVSSA